MTTQADITLAMFNINQAATTLSSDINILINAIADQNNITGNNLTPQVLGQLNSCQAQLTALIATIGSVAGGSAV